MPVEIYLRFRLDDGTGRLWLRRGLFALGWSRVGFPSLASPFPSREEAFAFAEAMKLAGDVELVTMTSEEVRR